MRNGDGEANPAEEWIYPTCEYRLFYVDEQGYQIGVRNQKKKGTQTSATGVGMSSGSPERKRAGVGILRKKRRVRRRGISRRLVPSLVRSIEQIIVANVIT